MEYPPDVKFPEFIESLGKHEQAEGDPLRHSCISDEFHLPFPFQKPGELSQDCCARREICIGDNLEVYQTESLRFVVDEGCVKNPPWPGLNAAESEGDVSGSGRSKLDREGESVKSRKSSTNSVVTWSTSPAEGNFADGENSSDSELRSPLPNKRGFGKI
jgi:hypothetical protein